MNTSTVITPSPSHYRTARQFIKSWSMFSSGGEVLAPDTGDIRSLDALEGDIRDLVSKSKRNHNSNARFKESLNNIVSSFLSPRVRDASFEARCTVKWRVNPIHIQVIGNLQTDPSSYLLDITYRKRRTLYDRRYQVRYDTFKKRVASLPVLFTDILMMLHIGFTFYGLPPSIACKAIFLKELRDNPALTRVPRVMIPELVQ